MKRLLASAPAPAESPPPAMAAMKARVDPAVFVRIYRSTIVNVDRIKELQPHFNGEYVVLLKDDTKLKLSRSFLGPARAALGLE